MPKQAEHRSTAEKLEGLYSLQEDCLDAVFLGTSVVDRGISPMKIYEDTGICTYNLGTSAQPIQSSYFLLRETLKTQSPKVVFLEVSVLFQNKMNTSFYKILMDNLYGTATGLEMARLYGSMEEKGLLSGLIPMVSYHTRWSELSRKDFCPDEKTANYTMGYTPNAKISRITPAFETIYQSQTDAFLEDREKNYPEVSSWVPEYFDSILTLCTEHNARLILLKSPGFRSPYDNGWSLWKGEIVADLADTHGLTFLDMSTMDLCDLRTDTYDARHMNLRGAEKVSSYLGQFLRETLEPRKDAANEQFDTALETYRNIRRIAMLQTETDFQAYLNQLSAHRESWSWVVVGNGAFTGGLSQQDYLMLKDLGLEKIADAADSMAYGAVFAQGKQKMEKLSDRYFE